NQEITRDRSGNVDRELLGAFLAFTDLHVPLKIENDPDVGGRIELEQLYHEVVGARDGRPVDTIEAVTGRVLSNTGGVRRHVMSPLAETALAGKVRRRDVEVRQLGCARVNQHGRRATIRHRMGEEAKWVTGRNRDGPDVIKTPETAKRVGA